MICPLCQRDMPEDLMQKHHLMTRRTDKKVTEHICRECHKTLHGLWSNKDIRDSKKGLDSLEGILAQPEFQKALPFIRRLAPGAYMRMKESAGRRRKR